MEGGSEQNVTLRGKFGSDLDREERRGEVKGGEEGAVEVDEGKGRVVLSLRVRFGGMGRAVRVCLVIWVGDWCSSA